MCICTPYIEDVYTLSLHISILSTYTSIFQYTYSVRMFNAPENRQLWGECTARGANPERSWCGDGCSRGHPVRANRRSPARRRWQQRSKSNAFLGRTCLRRGAGQGGAVGRVGASRGIGYEARWVVAFYEWGAPKSNQEVLTETTKTNKPALKKSGSKKRSLFFSFVVLKLVEIVRKRWKSKSFKGNWNRSNAIETVHKRSNSFQSDQKCPWREKIGQGKFRNRKKGERGRAWEKKRIGKRKKKRRA